MRDTWTNRDLPVLQAIVEIYEETGQAMGPDVLEERTGLDQKSLQVALKALDSEEPPYISKMDRVLSGQIVFIGAPTGHARRAVGSWPTAEVVANRLIHALDKAAEREQDNEQKGHLRAAAAHLRNAGRDLAVSIGAAAINRQIGLS
jgi:hypothetical protein